MIDTLTIKKWTRPDSYMGAEWYDYYSAGVGQSRDSDCLERANFDAMLELLGGESETVILVSENHWAVGWVEWIAIHESNEEVIKKADEAASALADYPVLDEERFSRYESDEALLTWKHMSIKERVELLQKCDECIFSARNDDYFPDGTGQMQEHLISH